MDDHPRRLIHYDDIAVLVYDVDRDRLRRSGEGFRLR